MPSHFQSQHDRITLLETHLGIPPNATTESVAFRHSLESRMISIENRLSSNSSSSPSNENNNTNINEVWEEIEKLSTSLPLHTFASQSSTTPTVKTEIITSVISDLTLWSSNLSSINRLTSPPSNDKSGGNRGESIIDSSLYLQTKQLSPLLEAVFCDAADVIGRTVLLERRLDSLLERYESVMEGCNTLFVVADEQIRHFEQKNKLGLE